MKHIVVLRTNSYSKRWDLLLNALPDNYKVVIVADNTRNVFFYKGLDTVYFNQDSVNKAGLFIAKDMQWRFGDYVLYLAHHAYPDYEYMWLVEPDVYINEKNIADFFNKFTGCNYDYLCSYFSKADADWMWSKYLPEIDEVSGCRTFFPLIRISNAAVNYLYDERQKYATLANDEIFVATKLKHSNFSISTFDTNVDVKYDKNFFSYRMPHYLPFIKKKGEIAIFHPVFDELFPYLRHLYVKKSWKTLVKKKLGISNND